MNPTPDDAPTVAVITYLRPATRGGAYLVDAWCTVCQRDVVHGAGGDLDALVLDTRQAHCTCAPGVYTLTDVNDVLPGRVAAIRADEDALAARRAEARTRRAAA